MRGRRNYDRYMRVIKKYVSFDGPEHAQWQKESAEDDVWDADEETSWPRAWRREDSPLATRRRAAVVVSRESWSDGQWLKF